MTTPTEIINNAKSYAEESLEGAMSLADRAASTFYSPSGVDPGPLKIEEPLTPFIDTTPPEFGSSLTLGAFTGSAPAYDSNDIASINLSLGDAPLFDGLPNDLSAPNFDVTPFAGEVPTLNIPNIPSVPVPTPIDRPTLNNYDIDVTPPITAGSLPDLAVPFEYTRPDAPKDLYKEYERAYEKMAPVFKAFIDDGASAFLTEYTPKFVQNRDLLDTKVKAILEAKNTGMSEDIEDKIYERGRTRSEQEANKLMNEIMDAHKERGMFIPSGAVQAGIMQAKRGAAMANAQHASEVAIERMKIELQHFQFGLQLSQTMNQTAMQYMIQYSQLLLDVNNQTLQFASTFLDAMIKVYDLQFKLLDADIQIFKALVEQKKLEYEKAVFQFEMYKAELDAIKTAIDVDQTKVQLFQTLIEAEKTKMQLYDSQIQGIAKVIESEKVRLEVFGEEVKAYATKVDAKGKEFQAYAAAMQGNAAAAEAYAAEVKGYTAGVQAEESVANTKLKAIEASIKQHTAKTESFRAEVAAYEAEVRGKTAEFSAASTNEQNRLRAWQAVNESKLKQAQINTQAAVAINNARAEELRVNVETELKNKESWSRAMENRMKAQTDAANVYAHLAGTAMSAQNTIVQQYEEV